MMNDLISKSALVDRLSDAAVNAKAIEESSCANATTYYAGIKCGFWNAAIIADNFPTVDAVPVVRCKDCKWYGRADKSRFYRGMDCLNKRIATIVPDMDYCSKAERRTDGQT